MNAQLEAALAYRAKGFSIIPCGKDKTPLIKWLPHQEKQATEGQIQEWWDKTPDANPTIVTGAVSGIVVIDIDDMPDGIVNLMEYIPKDPDTPTAETPTGGIHLYFKHPGFLIGNNTGLVPGCDFRGDGGYVIAPPSHCEYEKKGKKIEGDYKWLKDFDEVVLAPLPSAYISFINSFAFKGYKGGEVNDCNGLHKTSSDFVDFFHEGHRNEDLFHVANGLKKGGAEPGLVRKVVQMLALQCDPPLSLKEAETIISSALNRNERKKGDIAEAVREWVMTSSGFFMTSECFNGLRLTSREEQKAGYLVFLRLLKEGVIEKHGERRGCFRIVDNQCEEIDFLNTTGDALDIRYPFQIERLVKTQPKNIIVVAGEPNAGKTAFELNFAEMNMGKHEVLYFSSEMGALELKDRLSKFDRPLTSWRVKFKERASNFADVIKPDAINIIDFLEVHDEFYKIGGLIKDIYDKLNTGLAVIAIQKNRGTEFGLGGMRSLEKARLYLAIEPGKIKIVKGKNWASQLNPNGFEHLFKLVQGCHFQEEGRWKKP